MEKFIVIWNDGVFYCDGKNVLSMEEVKSIFEGKKLCVMDDEDELVEIGVKELVEKMLDEKVEVYCDDLVEMGDDYVEVMLVKLVE